MAISCLSCGNVFEPARTVAMNTYANAVFAQMLRLIKQAKINKKIPATTVKSATKSGEWGKKSASPRRCAGKSYKEKIACKYRQMRVH